MSDATRGLQHGVHYVSRDGTLYNLDAYMERHDSRPIPRPERDVLAALLRFCLDGIDYWNARDRHLLDVSVFSPPGLISGPPRVPGDGEKP